MICFQYKLRIEINKGSVFFIALCVLFEQLIVLCIECEEFLRGW